MGYTQYFYTHKDGIPVSAWEKICADVRTLLANLPAHSDNAGGYHSSDPLEIAWEHDEPNKAPEVSSAMIQFNGTDGANDLGHETFHLERVPEQWDKSAKDEKEIFACCKTARKPYDLVVCGVLIVAAKHAGKYIRVSSDGDLEEWMPAFEWVTSLLGPEYTAGAVAARLTGDFQLGGVPEDVPEPPQDDTPVPPTEPEAEPSPEPVTTSHVIVVDVKEFRAALELAVADRKTTIPVLAGVLLQPQGSSLHVWSTDLDKSAVTEVPAMIDDGTTSVLVPHRKTLELLKGEIGILRLTASVTTLKDKFSHAWVKLEVGGCEYDIPAMNPTHFPALPEIPKSAFTIPGADLKATIGRIIGCISTEESRYTLNGALLEADKHKLLLVGTDGHRLALDSIPVRRIPKGKALIPRLALAWLYRESSGAVDVTLGDKESAFRLIDAHTTFITRNLTGNFPNYQAVTPRNDSFTLTASFPSGDELAKTLTKVARMADERSGAVKFAINGACVLSASSTDTGSASATVKATIKHSEDVPEIVTGFNSSFVLDALKVAGKSPVVLSLKDNQSAGVFTVPSLPEYSYVIMPMRL